jgi:hypothetical protein
MQNLGTDTVVIPWNVDSNVSIRPKDVSQYAYDVGWFELKLKGARKIEVLLSQNPNRISSTAPCQSPEAA